MVIVSCSKAWTMKLGDAAVLRMQIGPQAVRRPSVDHPRCSPRSIALSRLPSKRFFCGAVICSLNESGQAMLAGRSAHKG